jgi:transcriptional regulator with XRE-family HTH domain
MPHRKKPGRKKRPRTTAEKLLMNEFAEKLASLMQDRRLSVEAAARELGVSRASLYNYRNKNDLAGFEVLKRAHDLWDFTFQYVDFAVGARRLAPSEEDRPRQYVLSFIQGVQERDVEVVRAKPVKPDTLQLTVNIRFVG